jgi:uncharacterized protein (TIGR00106 family)
MIVAEVSVVPLGEGTSVSRYVRLAVRELESRLKTFSGPMSSCVEAESLREVFDAVEAAHQAVVKAGAKRVVTTLKVDDRRDKEATMESKMKAVNVTGT